MISAELAPLELAGRLALALGLAVFLGLAFEEVYKREERSTPGGIRTFPILALSGAMLYLIEPRQALAFIVGLIALAIWLHLVGATDIDPFVINIAQGGVAGLSIAGLCAAILIAASSNNIAKAIYALGFGGIETSRRPASLLFILAMLGFAAAAVYVLLHT